MSKIDVVCKDCLTAKQITTTAYRMNMRKNGHYLCHRCACTRAGKAGQYKGNFKSRSKASKDKWRDSSFRKAITDASIRSNTTDNYKDNQRARSLDLWQDPNYASRVSKSVKDRFARDKTYAARVSEGLKAKYQNDDSYLEIVTEIIRKRWKDPKFIELFKKRCGDLEYRDKLSVALKEAFADSELRARLSANSRKLWSNNVYRQRVISGLKRVLSSPEARRRLSDIAKTRWEDCEYRAKMAVLRAVQPRTSSIQILLYNFLDDLNVEYYKESVATTIGYYVFDCLVKNPHGKDLLIECQGDYWHSLPGVQARDRGKFTYIDNYFPEYEIMYVWEHEFYTKDRVLDRLKLKLGIDVALVEFDFADISVRKVSAAEVRSFLDSYHYIGKGRGGRCYGAFLNTELIACAIVSPPIRQGVVKLVGDLSAKELSRFCIHPAYHKKNFASWFISRTIKEVGTTIIAYADTTVGHLGTIYRAANFDLHHEVAPNYWYTDGDGYVMHKKTLYQRARKMKLTERAFAEKYNYQKKWGGKKLCFIYGK